MLPGAVMVVVPPKRPAVSEMAATLVTVPPVWLSVVAVPPVRLAWPPVTERTPSAPLDVKTPVLLTIVVPLTEPLPCTVAEPADTASVPPMAALAVKAPPETVKLPACVEPLASVRLPLVTGVLAPVMVPLLTTEPPATERLATWPPAAIVVEPPLT